MNEEQFDSGLPLKPLSQRDPLGDLLEASSYDADLADQEMTENARTVAAKKRALERAAREWSAEQALVALNDAAAAINTQLDLRRVIKDVLEIAIHTMGAERGVIFLGGAEGIGLIPVLAQDIGGKELTDVEQVSRTILDASSKAPVMTNDATNDPRFRDVPSIRAKKIRSVACAAMFAGGERVGAIYVDSPSRERAFPEQCLQFLEVFAQLAAIALQNARRHAEVLRERDMLRRRVGSLGVLYRLNSSSSGMAALCRRAMTAALGTEPVLLIGEKGTEKELTARSVHEFSTRSVQPFIHLHCAGLPAELLGELLGDKKTAGRVPSIWRRADRGVLYLEEISELDLRAQARLAALLRSGMIREGPRRRRPEADVRLISSMSISPGPAIKRGEFLAELYDQIATIELRIPPLRERREDIPLLIEHFLRLHQGGESAPAVSFSSAALEALQAMPWRRNVTELENFVQRALIFVPGGKVDVKEAERLAGAATKDLEPGLVAQPGASSPGADLRSLAEQAHDAICDALAKARGNKTKAARFLGIHRNTLLRRMSAMNLEWKRPRRNK